MIRILITLLAACAPPLRPMPADPLAARAAWVFVQCGASSAVLGGDPSLGDGDPDAPWNVSRRGVAVILGPQTAITAAHVVACPEIPTVHLVLASGEIAWSAVTEESGRIARVEIWGAFDRYGDFAPPHSAGAIAIGDLLCAYLPTGARCGAALHIASHEVEFSSAGFAGESGAGVWRGGEIVGLVEGISDAGNAVAEIIHQGGL